MQHFTRRELFEAGAGMVGLGMASGKLAASARGSGGSRRQTASTLIRGGMVYDGAGRAPIEGDVLITGDRIASLGTGLRAPDAVVLDARGMAVAPGFVDIHSHTDTELLVAPRAESKIRQGVTTEITGQDGGSMGPWTEERAAETRESYRQQYGLDVRLGTLGDFLDTLERHRFAVNLASMVGHGTIRQHVIGDVDRPATSDELRHMAALVRDALAAGAVGLSSGLEYIPGAFATLDELVTLTRELRGSSLPYASHMRNEDDQLLAAVEEALNVGRAAGVPVQISHLKAQGERNWWKAGPVLEALERARAAGVDVTFDRYPYVAYSTGLSSLFPPWAREGGTDAFLARLDDGATAARIEAYVRDKIDQLGSWDAVQISGTRADEVAWARGRRLGELSAERGTEPYALLLHLIRADRARSGMVGFGMSEENTARILSHPLAMICSDGSALPIEGPLAAGAPHPRNYGTYPRVLGHYCRERGVMPLEVAIAKMSSLPAQRVRLEGRGVLAPGAFADVVVFDPVTVADLATFDNPKRYPTGIHHVFVNGQWTLREGEPTGALAGRVLRGPGWKRS